MYQRDHPKEIRVWREGVMDPAAAEAAATARWADVFTGPAYARFIGQHLPPEAVLRRLRGASPLRRP